MNRHNEYTALLMRHREMLWQMCRKRADGDNDRSSDLLQEVSIALWENFDKLRPDATAGQERAWVRWQARSVFFQIGRQKKPQTVPLGDTLSDTVPDEDTRQRKELIDSLLSALDPDEQQMVRLYLEGYDGNEIGQKMGISRDTYYQRMHRAILKMRRLALVLLALLCTSALAIAAVPQWRHVVFGGWNRSNEAADTTSTPTADTLLATALPDTATLRDTIAARPARETDTLSRITPLVPLDPDAFEALHSGNAPVHLTPIAKKDKFSVALNGTRLIITGAAGEMVRVYDMGNRLVFYDRAASICLIDLFPSNDIYPVEKRYQFRLQVGKRPTIEVYL